MKNKLVKIFLFVLLIQIVSSFKIHFEEENLTPKIKERVQNLISKIPQNENEENILISVGDTKTSKEFITEEELKKQGKKKKNY